MVPREVEVVEALRVSYYGRSEFLLSVYLQCLSTQKNPERETNIRRHGREGATSQTHSLSDDKGDTTSSSYGANKGFNPLQLAVINTAIMIFEIALFDRPHLPI